MTPQGGRREGTRMGRRTGLRISAAEAVRRGWIRESDASAVAPSRMPAARAGRHGVDPQAVLYQAICQRLGAERVRCEVAGLVPGRRYRADIVIAEARLVIEFDGFAYHRSREAFQKDRDRQNAFVAHGWRVLRFFNRQVLNDLDGVLDQVQRVVQGERGARAC